MTTERKYGASDSQRNVWPCRHKWLMRFGLGLQLPESSDTPTRDSVWSMAMRKLPQVGLPGALRLLHDLERSFLDGDSFLAPLDKGAQTSLFRLARCMLSRYAAHYATHPRMTTVMSPQHVSVRVRTPAGHRSTVSDYSIDMPELVVFDGLLCMRQHVATSRPLSGWLAHQYDPNAAAMAWLASESIGRSIEGIVYDLAHSEPLKRAEDFKLIKNGTRLHKGAGNTTAAEFRRALQLHGLSEHDGVLVDGAGWYTDALATLEHRRDTGYWFRRELVPMDRRTIERAGGEVYAVATEIRQAGEATSEMRAELRDMGQDAWPGGFGQRVAEMLQKVGASYPRASCQCFTGGRACAYLDLCRSHSANDASDFRTVGGNNDGASAGVEVLF